MDSVIPLWLDYAAGENVTSDLLEAESHVNGDTSIQDLCSFKFFVWDLGVSVSVWRPTNICTPTKFGKATCLPTRVKT